MIPSERGDKKPLSRHLSIFSAWALSFGCSVGWGSFVMPGTTFLPIAGPLGTVLGIAIGSAVMILIGLNYHYMINLYPDAGGTYTYTNRIFGYDHGFLCGWFLILTYIAVLWANATALPLIARNLFGGLFQVGTHYQILGYDIYMGEAGLAITAIILSAFFCLRNKVSDFVQGLMALFLLIGVVVCVSVVWIHAIKGGVGSPEPLFSPAFSPKGTPGREIFNIVALAPWAFVGFESISHSAEEFNFPHKKTWLVFVIAIITSAIVYILLALCASMILPAGFTSWTDYIFNIGQLDGIQGLPTFHAVITVLGSAGIVLLGLAALGGIFTGVIGNTVAVSRVLYAMGRDKTFPAWFGEVDEKNHIPKNTILVIGVVSLFIPFMGRTAIGWIVDVTTVGAIIVYAYTSAATLKTAKKLKNSFHKITGELGLLISMLFLLFFLVPNILSISTLSTESYLILATWSLLGFLVFRAIFVRDKEYRFGRSTIIWIVLLGLIIFTSTIWMKQEANKAIGRLAEYARSEDLAILSNSITFNTIIQMALIIAALLVIFNIYAVHQKREKQIEVEKALAEESSRAKTSFLSNMSHEIRTPMNAIIGLQTLALRDPELTPRTREQLEKIGSSAKHLLSLINDVLDMSRIESGRMQLKEHEFDFREFLEQINIMVSGQCADKGLDYECTIQGKTCDYYVGDDMKLKQVLINILGNAVKFTNPPGSVTFSVEQTAFFEGHCTLQFIIKDTGIGMDKEYIPKIFDAFSQEDEHTINKYGSTGLGMAITKNLVEMMNGDIQVESEKGVGTTFIVKTTLKSSSRSAMAEDESMIPANMRLLVVDDDKLSCEHAQMVSDSIGIEADYCTSGKEALSLIRIQREADTPYQIVLTDYKMPGMNGIEFAKALREFDHGETAIIILTGYNWDDILESAKEAGVDGIMSKPLFTYNLHREIERVIIARHGDSKGELIEEDLSDITESLENVTDFSETARMETAAGAGYDTEISETTPGTGLTSTIDTQAEEEKSLAGLNILIAEDLDINAGILMDLLEIEDIESEHATNGKIAVDMFAASEPGTYDVILMDIRMPVMDGLEATKTIRALDRQDAKEIPIIALSANAFDDDVQRSLQAGMTAHLSKPVDPDLLFKMLRQL